MESFESKEKDFNIYTNAGREPMELFEEGVLCCVEGVVEMMQATESWTS